MAKSKVKLGDKVRDTISGYEGIVTGIYHYLNGCTRIGISGPMGDSDKEPPTWVFDEPQVEAIAKEAHPVGAPGGGGPRSARPPQR